jgi:hypothetical protein
MKVNGGLTMMLNEESAPRSKSKPEDQPVWLIAVKDEKKESKNKIFSVYETG